MKPVLGSADSEATPWASLPLLGHANENQA